MKSAVYSAFSLLAAFLLLPSQWALSQTAPELPAASGKNIALGKKYTLAPKPAYSYCTDPDDVVQLTDGKLTEGYFWTQKGCVGWKSTDAAIVTIDLGSVEPIRGVSFRTAAGVAGVTWPAAIEISVSDDGKNYRIIDDLVDAHFKAAHSWPQGYGVVRLQTDKLHTRGRFVRLLVIPSSGCFAFCDEIEVFRGPEAWLKDDPGGRSVGNPKQRAAAVKMHSAIRSRYMADLAETRKILAGAEQLNAEAKQSLQDRVDAAAKKLAQVALPDDKSFRAVLPYCDAHAELFAVQAAVWQSLGLPPLSVWVVNPWDPSELFTTPPAPGGEVEIHAMRGEYRAAAINLANSTQSPLSVRLRVEGLPGGGAPGYLSVAQSPWTDTGEGRPVLAALPTVEPAGGCWTLKLLPGMVAQAWCTLRAEGLPDGLHQGQIVCEYQSGEKNSGTTKTFKTPLAINVYPFTFPEKTTLEVGGWSYSNGRGAYGMTPKNRPAFIRHLQERFVNAPWATSSVLMSFKIDGGGALKLDTREMDDWLAEWPEARRYYVFMSLGGLAGQVRDNFAGAKSGTPEFDARIAAWINAWTAHLKTKGIEPERLGILFYDEPMQGCDAEAILKWIRAVRAAQPRVTVWLDPIYNPPKTASLDLLAACDILCPNRPMWLAGGKGFADFYLDQQRQGRTLQFYSCSGPARLLDPYAYYRLQAWQCRQVGATGLFFWAFGDNGGASSWNEYLSVHGPFTPLYIDADTVTAGKHMEAIRESVEDYETLLMLEKAVAAAKAAGRTGPALAAAEKLLATAADTVLGAENLNKIRWHEAKNRSAADSVRIEILKALVELKK